uniref:CSON006300 protein n=1 Tax=Culicoides sonorensis TaxID=179676 RepID=A0A336MTA6_CULSO
MKFVLMTVFVCLLVIACVFAAPANDETIVGVIGEGQDAANPQDPQGFLKLLLLKKKLLLLG